MRKTLVAAGLCFAASSTLAQGPGYGYGPGMMGGYGAGYGPGMMGGQGYGPGMMRGYGRGEGYGLGELGLTQEQSAKIAAIREENRRKNWGTMGEMRGEMFKLRQMYSTGNEDSNAVLEQHKKVDELRRQMIASHLEARKQVESVLTPEQRKQLRQFGPGWMREKDGG